ncbi:MAG TPA: cupin domain-containing protein [Chthoniobacterales bacterium]|nr:cupin domain-containing protein [Chthoniobacterales bacterium]
MKKTTSVALLAAVAALGSFAFAADEKPKDHAAASAEHVMIAPGDLKWSDGPAGLPAGAKIAVVSGDRTKAGLFTIRLEFPAGFKVPPHTHPVAEHVTVISGTLNLGSGPKFDETATHEMTAGSFAAMPAGMQHFAHTKTGCVLQVHAMGPFEIKYVNPADDPRQAKK